MHVKSDSEVTSLDASSPPRSPRRPLYYVQSPSQHDAEKMSYGSSPLGSPHHYHCSPIHHSRESSTSRFSASLKNPHKYSVPWKKIHQVVAAEDGDDEDDDGDDKDSGNKFRLYFCFVFGFIVLFSFFSLILWGASRTYKPKIIVKNIVFQNFIVQAGFDNTGVQTDMLSMNSTVKISYRNPATFFGVHVSSTPLELYYYQLKIASGHMKDFYQSRKSQRTVATVVLAYQVPLYGGISALGGVKGHYDNMVVPLNLTFVMRSRADILGKLVKSKFHKSIRCPLILRGNRLGKPQNLSTRCSYK